MAGFESDIIRVSTGKLNTVNDTFIGGAPAGSIGLSTANQVSQYSSQLGKRIQLTSEEISTMFSSTVGTLYAGWYRYVRFRTGDDASPVHAPGKIVYWDTTLTNWQTLYQVTFDVNLSSATLNGVLRAGVCIGAPTNGNYGFIQDAGLVNIRFRSVLTVAGVIGSASYEAGTADTGNDQGTADVLTTDSTSIANQRYLGVATVAPTGGSLTPVILEPRNVIG